MPTARYVTFKSYSGFLVRGSVPVPPAPVDAPHVVRTFGLLSRLEASNFGTVQSYDGVGMSAGPLHAIAISRSFGQGPLWGLIAMIFEHAPAGACEEVDELRRFLAGHNVHVTPSGELAEPSGQKVRGQRIRDEILSTPDGRVPTSGPVFERAKEVALMFNRVFSAPVTFNAQQAFTIRWLLRGQEETESRAYAKYSATKVKQADVPRFLVSATAKDLGTALDLGMAVYHAFSVNAPAPAVSELRKAMVAADPQEFARRLIRGLGTKKFARWKDTPDNKNRYDQTRIAAERAVDVNGAHLWSADLLSALMPVNF